MFRLRLFLLMVLIVFLLLPLQSCKGSESVQKEMDYRVIPEIKEIKPERPVRVKLKRSTRNKYSWELSGDNVDRIIEIDKKLREAVGKTEVRE